MSPLVAYHVTRFACRKSISENGLLPNRPTGGRPYGVYVFRPDGALDHGCKNSWTEWTLNDRQDMWEVAYIGPLMQDDYVLNAVILLGDVDKVTLVTGNYGN